MLGLSGFSCLVGGTRSLNSWLLDLVGINGV